MNNLKIYKNFFSKDECAKLNQIAMRYLEDGTLKLSLHHFRYTTRYIGQDFQFDPFPLELLKRVRKECGLESYEVENRGSNGVNIAVTVSDGVVEPHLDPRTKLGYASYRCNVVTQKSESGGELIIEDELFTSDEGDLFCYPVTEIKHMVTDVKGKTPRILWMFCFYVPLLDLGPKKDSNDIFYM